MLSRWGVLASLLLMSAAASSTAGQVACQNAYNTTISIASAGPYNTTISIASAVPYNTTISIASAGPHWLLCIGTPTPWLLRCAMSNPMPWLFRIAGTAWCESKWIVLNMIIPLGDFARLAYVSCQVSGDRATGLWRCGVATALLASVHSLRVTLWAQGRACLWAACGAVVVAFLALFHGGLLQPSMILKGTAAGLYLSHASGSRRWALVLLTVLWVPLCVWYRVRQGTCDRSSSTRQRLSLGGGGSCRRLLSILLLVGCFTLGAASDSAESMAIDAMGATGTGVAALQFVSQVASAVSGGTPDGVPATTTLPESLPSVPDHFPLWVKGEPILVVAGKATGGRKKKKTKKTGENGGGQRRWKVLLTGTGTKHFEFESVCKCYEIMVRISSTGQCKTDEECWKELRRRAWDQHRNCGHPVRDGKDDKKRKGSDGETAAAPGGVLGSSSKRSCSTLTETERLDADVCRLEAELHEVKLKLRALQGKAKVESARRAAVFCNDREGKGGEDEGHGFRAINAGRTEKCVKLKELEETLAKLCSAKDYTNGGYTADRSKFVSLVNAVLVRAMDAGMTEEQLRNCLPESATTQTTDTFIVNRVNAALQILKQGRSEAERQAYHVVLCATAARPGQAGKGKSSNPQVGATRVCKRLGVNHKKDAYRDSARRRAAVDQQANNQQLQQQGDDDDNSDDGLCHIEVGHDVICLKGTGELLQYERDGEGECKVQVGK